MSTAEMLFSPNLILTMCANLLKMTCYFLIFLNSGFWGPKLRSLGHKRLTGVWCIEGPCFVDGPHLWPQSELPTRAEEHFICISEGVAEIRWSEKQSKSHISEEKAVRKPSWTSSLKMVRCHVWSCQSQCTLFLSFEF